MNQSQQELPLPPMGLLPEQDNDSKWISESKEKHVKFDKPTKTFNEAEKIEKTFIGEPQPEAPETQHESEPYEVDPNFTAGKRSDLATREKIPLQFAWSASVPVDSGIIPPVKSVLTEYTANFVRPTSSQSNVRSALLLPIVKIQYFSFLFIYVLC